jgi:AbrB family looped-hinge helix DNA binding protein
MGKSFNDKMIDMKTNIVTVSPKYQVVIPMELRERLNIRPGSKMTMLEINGQVRLLPLLPPAAYRGIAKGLKDTDIPDEPERF